MNWLRFVEPEFVSFRLESTATLSNDKENETLKVPSKPQAHLIDSILQIICVKHKYLRYIDQYPSIVHYLIDDDPQDSSIPLRHLEPFIIAHVSDRFRSVSSDRLKASF